MPKKQQGNRLVVADAGWAETVPDWLLKAVKSERMIVGMAGVIKPDMEGAVGDAEVCVYLYTASLRAPVSLSLCNIYLNLAAKLMEQRGRPIPGEAEDRELDADEERELEDLRRELWRKRGGRIKSPLLDMMRSLGKRGTDNA